MAERVYVALDLETTGLDAKRDAIIEIGAVRFQGKRILDRFVTLVNPHRAIPLRIQQITNIRNSDVVAAPTIDAVLPELLAFVRADVAALIAHNAAFDLGFLDAAGISFQRPVLDTFELSTILLPGLGSYSLGELCRTLTIPLTDAHRALDDATATSQLFMTLQERAQQIAPTILDLIVKSAQQSDWSPTLLFADALAQAEQMPTGVMESEISDRNHSRPGDKATAQALLCAGQDNQNQSDAISPAIGATANPGVAPTPPSPLPAEENPITTTIAPQHVDDFFAANGPLAHHLGKTFEVRRGQIDMAQQVLRAFNEGDHMLLEAGTGIGKSMAYLVPAALWSVANGRRVVIATNTITLQEQLLTKDIPQLQQTLAAADFPIPLVTLLKGRRHYLCLRRFHAWRKSHRLAPAELTFLAKVLIWLPTTTDGEMEEIFLTTASERAYWEQVCSHPTTCTPELCDKVGGDYGVFSTVGNNWRQGARIPET
ncbi:MAG: 3'-5' exoribonuclease, partial [Caldilineaceae bacterium]|nr:3'-5' exoribonuclease [Caldilineaceae bacterium]